MNLPEKVISTFRCFQLYRYAPPSPPRRKPKTALAADCL